MSEPLVHDRTHGPAVPGFVDTVQDLLDRVLDGAPAIGPGDSMAFELAVVEVVANAVRHTVPGSAAVELEFEIEVRPDLLVARLYEIGAEPFDFPEDGSGMPALDEETGRGLALARLLLSTISCERRNESNLWVLTRRTPASEE